MSIYGCNKIKTSISERPSGIYVYLAHNTNGPSNTIYHYWDFRKESTL